MTTETRSFIDTSNDVETDNDNTADNYILREMFKDYPNLPGFSPALKQHMRFIKWICITLLISIPSIIVITNAVYAGVNNDFHNQQSENETATNISDTACVYIKKYSLDQGIYVHVCNRIGLIFVDIRRFINEHASVIGVQLNIRQWRKLKQYMSLIDKGILEARVYWNRLQTLDVT